MLVCTDGVADLIDDERIRQLLIAAAAGGPCAQARALVAAALQAGGTDNATALVVRNAPDASDVAVADHWADNGCDAAACADGVRIATCARAEEQESAQEQPARQARIAGLRNQELN